MRVAISSNDSHLYEFRDFKLDGEERVLRLNDQPVALTPKAFDTLFALVTNAGHIVAKDALMQLVWSDTFVEESNLTFNIRQVRKALGDDARKPAYIETIARRGYRFIAPVTLVARELLIEQPTIEPSLSTDAEGDTPETVTSNSAQASAVQPPSSAYRSIYLSAGLLIIAIICISGYALRQQRAAAPRSDFARLFAAPRIERLTDTGGSKIAVLTPDGSYLAYTVNSAAGEAIRLRHLMSDNEFEIVPATQQTIYALAFAPDGTQLYFTKLLKNEVTLYRVATLGGESIRLASGMQGAFTPAPDNRHLAFLRYNFSPDGRRTTSLIIFDTEAKTERELTRLSQPRNIFALVWSPDGARIACAEGLSSNGSREVEVTAYRVADSGREILSDEKWFFVEAIQWLHNEPGLVIAATMRDADPRRLWRISPLIGAAEPLTDETMSFKFLSLSGKDNMLAAVRLHHDLGLWLAPAANPLAMRKTINATGNFAWHTDERIIYSVTNGKFSDLWAAQSDGSHARQLTARAGVNDEPAIAPDTLTVAFISNRAGVFNIWRMDADGGNQTQLTNGAGERFPFFSRDGQWIFYSQLSDSTLWKVPAGGGVPVRVTDEPAILPSISPDGKRLAFLKSVPTGRNIVVKSLASDGTRPNELKLAEQRLAYERMQWTPDGQSLLYLAMPNNTINLFRQSLDGSLPIRLFDFNSPDIEHFAYSPNGQKVIVNRRSWQHDILLFTPQ